MCYCISNCWWISLFHTFSFSNFSVIYESDSIKLVLACVIQYMYVILFLCSLVYFIYH